MRTKTLPPLIALSIGAITPHAVATPTPTVIDGFEFMTIGDPGNRDPLESELADYEPPFFEYAGAVDYTFQMARFEITVAQYMEFLPGYVENQTARPAFDGFEVNRLAPRGVFYDEFTDQYFNFDVVDESPASVPWGMAARYVNWLHNGRVHEHWAYETGAYETATWQAGPDGEPPENPQLVASPDARFRLPSRDEWIKATFYDPNRYGEGEGGYWPYPNQSETAPVWAPPGEGGVTDSVEPFPSDDALIFAPVGRFPDAGGAWGVLDLSGSANEILQGDPDRPERFGGAGSKRFEGSIADSLEWSTLLITRPYPENSFGGAIRLITTIPTPASAAVFLIPFVATGRPRRR